ncbi:MAG: 4-alpha-glucanotransferase [Nitrospirota bacterium]|nr:4-alpha-glucanotransferase [Nitrospirota bacterium]
MKHLPNARTNLKKSSVSLLHQLARRHGIQPVFRDESGNRRVVPDESLRELLRLMGVRAQTSEQVMESFTASKESQWTKPVEETFVIPQSKISSGWALQIPIDSMPLSSIHITWAILGENKFRSIHRARGSSCKISARKKIKGRQYLRVTLPFPRQLPLGYYALQWSIQSPSFRAQGTSRVIVTPGQAYYPTSYKAGRGLWGLTVQLYGVRSERNWGVGDFGDLKDLVHWAGKELGAAMVGVNPLHALLPGEISPYSPSSRMFHHPLYLDIERIPEYRESPVIQRRVESQAFQKTLAALRSYQTVDYDSVKGIKFKILETLYRLFLKNHLVPRSRRGLAFLRFIRQQGSNLEHFACFQALGETFSRTRSSRKKGSGWQDWPKELRNPLSPQVQAFSHKHSTRINFFRYLEWLCQDQLEEVRKTARRIHMPIGLYQDLAVGIDPNGYEAWAFQNQLVTQASIGTPPEIFSPKGQNWNLVPLSPEHLHQQGYEVFIKTFQSMMAGGGLLRIDHAMGLFRLFWIPRGKPPSAGAYMHYPAEALLAILALESQKSHITIVGEDLGTITPHIRKTLSLSGLLSYRLLFFEKTKNGNFISPHRYKQSAMVAVSTHDLPTLKGFWEGRDIQWKTQLHMYPDRDAPRKEWSARNKEKGKLLQALRKEGLLTDDTGKPNTMLSFNSELQQAVYAYLARTPSYLLAVSLEDLLGDIDTPNIPGASPCDYPVWRMKAGPQGSYFHEWRASPDIAKLVRVINRERKGRIIRKMAPAKTPSRSRPS